LQVTTIEPGLFDTVPEASFGSVSRKVVSTLNVPIAVVALAEDDRVLLKSSVGLPEPWASLREMPLSASFCDSIVTTKRAMVVPDRWQHPTLRHRLPGLDVTGYAGVPLISSEGAVLGTLMALDPRRRDWSEDEIASLTELAAEAATQAELHLVLLRWKQAQGALRESQEHLRQAQKLASIGLFAGEIAHDFNNLLTVVLSSVPPLEDALADRPQAREELEEIEGAVRRGASLTRQLLSFARRRARDPQLIDMNAVIRGTERLLRRVINPNIELTTQLTSSSDLIWADAGQLEQVLVNLGLNARDAMPVGGRMRIETAVVDLSADFVSAHPDALPGPHVEIAISDTGHGMAAEILARIFEPLFSTKPQAKGAGLGLSISYGIVRENGGHITVSSAPGKGTTFRLHFPRVQGESPLTQAKDSPELPRRGETILLAEDHAALRSMAARTLRRLGYTVLEAAEGSQAIRVAAAHRGAIHLLITDVIAPYLSGRCLAEELRRSRPELKVIFLSSYTADVLTDVELGSRLALLGKPYTPTQLARQVREILESHPD
jgi:signal transduction histidine kinase